MSHCTQQWHDQSKYVLFFFSRYDKENSELVNDELGVAFPIVNGIPNLVPQDARMIKQETSKGSAIKTWKWLFKWIVEFILFTVMWYKLLIPYLCKYIGFDKNNLVKSRNI